MGVDAKKRPAMGWLIVALALGMLIWVRLRLVTDIPRSAYAEPENRSQPAGVGQASAPAAGAPGAAVASREDEGR